MDASGRHQWPHWWTHRGRGGKQRHEQHRTYLPLHFVGSIVLLPHHSCLLHAKQKQKVSAMETTEVGENHTIDRCSYLKRSGISILLQEGRLHHQRPRRWMQVGAINDRIDGRTEGGEATWNKDTSSIVHIYLCTLSAASPSRIYLPLHFVCWEKNLIRSYLLP